ncbi:hypothetical protein LSH36_611g03056 [Paralvinella palmiformis]|uniref:Integrase catalytic domain-containing protein n=1 Tax=Paralvinella palmiformis TaxID=53620 RepID=A0AAD9MUL8_9ANNE|nr:hypothetical protein LSH36_611g03056 [Paralvinella palmiformis]
MQPLMKLTRKEQPWIWEREQAKAFSDVQKLVTQAPILTYFDVNKPITVQSDSSEKGMGAVLLIQDSRPVVYASRALRDTETKYVQVEKEMLAIVWSLERFHQYTFGKHIVVQSDHKPLESLMCKPLSKAPRRLQGMMMHLMKYDTEIIYTKGTNIFIADMLSRAYVNYPSTEQSYLEHINAVQHLPIRQERLKQIQLQTERGEQIVIPIGLRADMKKAVHSSHIGIEGSLRRARECLFWPVDYFSNFWEIDKLNRTTSNAVIKKIKAHFSRYGIPSTVMTDNEPQFTAEEFRKFAQKYDFEHVTPSPHYPQSNGKVEAAVKSAKRMLKKTRESGADQYLTLLDIRNTPTNDLPSPAQRLINRRTRTLIPMTDRLLEPALRTDTKSKLQYAKYQQAAYYNRNAKDLVILEEGNVVRMKPYSPNITWKTGVITKRLDERSYQVDTDSGTYRHNRSHLRKTNESDHLNDGYSSTTNAKVKHYVADQPAMSDYSYTRTPMELVSIRVSSGSGQREKLPDPGLINFKILDLKLLPSAWILQSFDQIRR